MLPFLYEKINKSLKEDTFEQEYLYAEDTTLYINEQKIDNSDNKEERGVLILEL